MNDFREKATTNGKAYGRTDGHDFIGPSANSRGSIGIPVQIQMSGGEKPKSKKKEIHILDKE